MEELKKFVLQYFEKILVSVILVAAFAGTYFIAEKLVVLNFYYLPVLVAGYFLGRRFGVLSAVFSILVVMISGLVFPERFFPSGEKLRGAVELLSWGGFLILASITVGTLYERNEQKLKELKNAYVGILEILSKYLESTDRYTKGHSVRVAELAMEIGIAMDLPRPEVETIRVAGLLHDIGKIEVSGEILTKAAALSSEEKELMDLHTVKGAYILTAVGGCSKRLFQSLLPITIILPKRLTGVMGMP